MTDEDSIINTLTDSDYEKIAEKLVEKVQAKHHDFWIDPETHYQDHLKMRDISKTYDTGMSLFFKAFLGLVVIGSVVLAFFGITKGVVK